MAHMHGPAMTQTVPTRTISGWAPLALLLALVFAFRSIHFGNPDVSTDESFYLLVGDRMLHGAVPYVDIWDRKPVGLFVLYAAIRLLGGDGFLQYIVVSAFAVMATAALLWDIARRWSDPWSAILPALAFVVWQEPYDGSGGQTGTFNNLIAMAGFWLLLRARAEGSARTVLWRGAGVLALIGVGLQIKYTLAPIGVMLALGFLFLGWRKGASLLHLALAAVAYIALACLPSALAIGWYWQAGHLDAFLDANVFSTLKRHSHSLEIKRDLLHFAIGVSLPLIGTGLLGISRLLREGDAARVEDGRWTALFLLACIISYVMIGNYHHNYYQPVAMGLALAGGANLADRRWGLMLFAIVLAFPFLARIAPVPNDDAERRRDMAAMSALIAPAIDPAHCLYVFDGPVSLYMTAHSCLPTAYVFPEHLSNAVETGALGIDQSTELARVLANRPGAIVTAWPAARTGLAPDSARQLHQVLASDYQRIRTIVYSGHRLITIWHRRKAPLAGHPTLTAWETKLAS